MIIVDLLKYALVRSSGSAVQCVYRLRSLASRLSQDTNVLYIRILSMVIRTR
jgi:hypothetical protein